MTGETHCKEVGAPVETWGVWESAAATVLFSAPAFLLYWKVLAAPAGVVSHLAFDSVDWLIVGVALAGGLALSFVAGGVRFARLYVTTGLSSCFVWLVLGLVRPSAVPLAAVYRPLVFADLAAHFNLLPFVLLSVMVRSRASLPDDIVPRLRSRMWAVAGAAAALDASPLVWLLAPARWRNTVAFGWAGACIAVGVVFAVLVATEIASHAHPECAENG